MAIEVEESGVTPAVHFVAFRGDEYWSALRLWGRPAFTHRRWDQRAKRELHPTDKVVFARSCDLDPPSRFNGSDVCE